MSTTRFWVSLIAVTAASAGLSTSVRGQTELSSLFVDDPRPLNAAVSSLIDRYPVTITYEDPRYEYSGDIRDVTDQVRRSSSASTTRTLVPRGGVLQASYAISSDTGQPVSIADAIQSIVAAKNASPVGGRFGVDQSGDTFHIVPAEVRDSEGAWVKQQSVLSTRITLSREESNGYELIEAILKAVSAASGLRIGLSAERFLNSFVRYNGRVVAKDEPARDVLMRALHSISPRFTWLLNYDPSGHYYVFAVAMGAEPPRSEIPLDLSNFPRPGDPTPAGPPFQWPRN